MSQVKQDTIVFRQKDYPLLWSRSKPNPTQISLWHEVLEIKYVRSGRITMMIETETVSAQAGDIIVVNPCEVHSNLVVDSHCGIYDLFILDLDFFKTVGINTPDLRSLMTEQRVQFHNFIQNPQAGAILAQISRECASRDSCWQQAVTGLLMVFFAVLLRQETRADRLGVSFADRQKFYKSVEPAVVRLRDRYFEQFTGEELASACSMSCSHFCRIFRRAIGVTPVQYQNQCRLRIADILLKSSDLRISEISERVGFRDEAYFSRAYKKIHGISPQAARAKLSK